MGDTYYRDDVYNVPHKLDGSPIGHGPWLRIGYADAALDGKFLTSQTGEAGIIAICRREDDDACNGNAAVFIAPHTEVNFRNIKAAGFERGEVPIPERFSDVKDHVGRDSAFFSEIEQGARGRRVKLFKQEGIYPVSNREYREVGSKALQNVPVITDGRHLGSYNISGGIVGIVDYEGHQYIADYQPSLIDALQEMKFIRSRNLEVPFSQGQRMATNPTDTEPTRNLASFLQKKQSAVAYKASIAGNANMNLGISI